MKRKIICLFILTVLLFSNQKISAQWVVSDPGHTTLNSVQWGTNLGQWAKQLTEMIDAQKIREGLQKIEAINELNSLVELAELVDNVACLSAEYQFYLNLGNNYNCLKFLNFKQVSANMKLTDDLLRKIVLSSSLFSMNSEGRMNFITQAKNALEKSAKDMEEYNQSIRSVIRNKASRKYLKKTYYNASAANFNRYQSF